MGTEKRERQKANRQLRLQEMEAAEKAASRRSRMGLFTVLGFFILGLLLLVRFAGGDDETAVPELDPSAVSSTTTPEEDDGAEGDDATEVTTPAEPAVLTIPEPGAEITGETPCPAEDGSSERATSFENAPPMCIDDDASYEAVVSTSKGDFTIELDAASAPLAANNFVVLSRYGYYDDVPFHRIIPGFVIQGGDPVGTPQGTGNPGYQFDDETPSADDAEKPYYPRYSLAMANSGPATNGSQFFVVTTDNDEGLDGLFGQDGEPLHTRFGTVVDGTDVVDAIEAAGSPTGAPTEEVLINSVTITEN